jgi:hypothetical protein
MFPYLLFKNHALKYDGRSAYPKFRNFHRNHHNLRLEVYLLCAMNNGLTMRSLFLCPRIFYHSLRICILFIFMSYFLAQFYSINDLSPYLFQLLWLFSHSLISIFRESFDTLTVQDSILRTCHGLRQTASFAHHCQILRLPSQF